MTNTIFMMNRNETLMFSNSTNIKKTNKHISPLINEHKRDHDDFRKNPSPGLGQA